MKARLLFRERLVFDDGSILEVKIWDVPQSVPPSRHRFKYSLFYGRPGQRIVAYDNERGKGDHRHYGDREEPYIFETIDKLRDDFLADVARERGALR